MLRTFIKDMTDSLKKEAFILHVSAGIILLAVVFWIATS